MVELPHLSKHYMKMKGIDSIKPEKKERARHKREESLLFIVKIFSDNRFPVNLSSIV